MSWEPRHERLYKDGVLIRHKVQRTPDGPWEDYVPEEPPPQREWQGLTDEEIEKLYLGSFDEGQFARAIEAKLKEKNT